MRSMTEPELNARIQAFIEKKSAKFPDLRNEPRLTTRSALKHTYADSFKRLYPAL